jgi:hypothetical protein
MKSFEISLAHSLISDFGFRISDLLAGHTGTPGESGGELRSQNSTLKTETQAT